MKQNLMTTVKRVFKKVSTATFIAAISLSGANVLAAGVECKGKIYTDNPLFIEALIKSSN